MAISTGHSDSFCEVVRFARQRQAVFTVPHARGGNFPSHSASRHDHTLRWHARRAYGGSRHLQCHRVLHHRCCADCDGPPHPQHTIPLARCPTPQHARPIANGCPSSTCYMPEKHGNIGSAQCTDSTYSKSKREISSHSTNRIGLTASGGATGRKVSGPRSLGARRPQAWQTAGPRFLPLYEHTGDERKFSAKLSGQAVGPQRVAIRRYY
jgi:hypothetical protein